MFPPVAIGQARLVSADLKLAGGFCLPAGAAALVPHHAMHSASFNWDKPNEFLPGFSLCNRVCRCLLVVPSYKILSGTAPCHTERGLQLGTFLQDCQMCFGDVCPPACSLISKKLLC